MLVLILSCFKLAKLNVTHSHNETRHQSFLTRVLVETYFTAMVNPEYESMNNVDKLKILYNFRLLLKRQLDTLINKWYLFNIKNKVGELTIQSIKTKNLLGQNHLNFFIFNQKKGTQLDEFFETFRKRIYSVFKL